MVIGGDVKKWPCPNCGHGMRLCERDVYDSKGNPLGIHAFFCERCGWEQPVDLSKYIDKTEACVLRREEGRWHISRICPICRHSMQVGPMMKHDGQRFFSCEAYCPTCDHIEGMKYLDNEGE